MSGATEPLTARQTELYEAAMDCVERIAWSRSRKTGIPVDDLRQEGAIGALRAVRDVLPLWERTAERYAATSARNAIADAGRWWRRRPLSPFAEAFDPAEPEGDGLDRDEVELIRDAIRSLGTRPAVMLLMRVYVGATHDEIAARFNVSHKTVSRTLDASLERLRRNAAIQSVHESQGA